MTSCCSHHGGLHETTYMLNLVTLLKPCLFRLMSFDRHTRELWCGFRCAPCFNQLVCYSNSIILYLPVSCRKTWRPTSNYARWLVLRDLWGTGNECSRRGKCVIWRLKSAKCWGQENNEAHNGPKKLENIENYLMWTLRETVMAFQMREIRFAAHAAHKIRKPHRVTLQRSDQFFAENA